MIVYLDTSVIVRHMFGETGRMRDWGQWERCYTADLTRIEYYRTLDRLRLEGKLDDDERVEMGAQFEKLWAGLYRMPLSQPILARAAESFPTVLGTLDAIHLAGALAAQKACGSNVTLLTHDRQLATAASAVGMAVRGAEQG